MLTLFCGNPVAGNVSCTFENGLPGHPADLDAEQLQESVHQIQELEGPSDEMVHQNHHSGRNKMVVESVKSRKRQQDCKNLKTFSYQGVLHCACCVAQQETFCAGAIGQRRKTSFPNSRLGVKRAASPAHVKVVLPIYEHGKIQDWTNTTMIYITI